MPIHVAADPDALANHAADLIADLVDTAGDDRTSLGLTGGSTPQATYRQLRWTPIDWSTVDLWLSDERWVPHDPPDSNGRAALESIGPDPAIRLLRPRWSTYMTADDSAAFYEATLRHIIPTGEPDVVLLGMGEIKVGLTVQVHRASASALKKVEKAGGKVELIEW